MTLYARFLTVLVAAAFAGCASTPRAPITADAVAAGIKLRTGYDGCPGCSKVKTYVSPPVIDDSMHSTNEPGKGWINARVYLVATNNTDRNVPAYQLLAEFTNNGDFQSETDLYYRGEGMMRRAGDRRDAKCFSNIGSGCSWKQSYFLDTGRVEDALKNGTGLALVIGRDLTVSGTTNDGYKQSYTSKETRVGMRAEISAQALAGFVRGLQDRNAELPSSDRDSSERLARKIEAADRMNAEADRLARERPLKQKVGTQVCRKVGVYTQIGFVEGSANNKVQIRVVEAQLTGTSMRNSSFTQQTIWDDPDGWYLCGK